MALQGSYTTPDTKVQLAAAYLVLDDVVVSLKGQIAAIHYSIYASSSVAGQVGVDPLVQDHVEATAPGFSTLQLGAIAAASLQQQIEQAAYQFLQSLSAFSGWQIVA